MLFVKANFRNGNKIFIAIFFPEIYKLLEKTQNGGRNGSIR